MMGKERVPHLEMEVEKQMEWNKVRALTHLSRFSISV